MLGKGRGYINVQCPNDQALETWPVETRLFLLFPKDLLEADAAGLAVSSGLDLQLWFLWKCTKKMKTPSVPHLPREVHHFVHCRQEEPGREDFKPAKWRLKSLQRKRKKRKISENSSKSQRQSYHSSVKIDAHPSAHSKRSRRVKDAFSGQIKFSWLVKNLVWKILSMFIIFTKILSEIFSENCHLLPGFVSAIIGFGVRRARFLPRFTSGQKQMVLDFVLILLLPLNPLNNFSGLCQFCLLLYVSTICNTVFECFIFTFQSNGQSLTKSTSAAS